MAVDYSKVVKKNRQTMERQTGTEPEQGASSVVDSVSVSEPIKKERPKTGAQRGLPDGWTRFTVTVPIELAEDMKDLAYTERLKLKDVVVRAFENAIKDVELMRRPDRKH